MKVLRYIAAVLLVGACLVALRRPYALFHCNQEKFAVDAQLRRTEGLTSEFRRRDEAQLVVNRANACLRSAPEDYEMLILRGLAEEQLERRNDAIATYRAALALNERPEIHMNIGLLLIQTRRPAEALEALAKACIFDFRYTDYVEFSMRKPLYDVITERRERLLAQKKR